MNHERNAEFANSAVNNAMLEMPVLFVAAQYDYTCDAINSNLAVPMRDYCRNLTERVVYSGHWMAQEKPVELNAWLARWLTTQLPQCWAG